MNHALQPAPQPPDARAPDFDADRVEQTRLAYRTGETVWHAVAGGNVRPAADACRALGPYDRAALAALNRHPELSVQAIRGGATLTLYANALGRLHVRPSDAPKVAYTPDDDWLELGHVAAGAEVLAEISARFADWQLRDRQCAARVRATLDRAHANGELPRVLQEACASITQIEPVCFYIDDRLYTLADRYEQMVGGTRGALLLASLRERGYAAWDDEARLIVVALYALKSAGRIAAFAEFNGAVLSAEALLAYLRALAAECGASECDDLFDWARRIHEGLLRTAGDVWLRYRWRGGFGFSCVASRERLGIADPLARASLPRRARWWRRAVRHLGARLGFARAAA
jgi:hypothetical protein